MIPIIYCTSLFQITSHSNLFLEVKPFYVWSKLQRGSQSFIAPNRYTKKICLIMVFIWYHEYLSFYCINLVKFEML